MLQPTQVQHDGKSNWTTRKFPRTLDEAFGHGADYGCAITRYKNHWSWVGRASAFVIWVLILAWGATLWI